MMFRNDFEKFKKNQNKLFTTDFDFLNCFLFKSSDFINSKFDRNVVEYCYNCLIAIIDSIMRA